MDSTTANEEPGRSTPRPVAALTSDSEAGSASRESQLAQILVARHEQLLASSDISVASDVPRPFRLAYADADTLTAEVEQLDDCLRRVERARREKVLRGALFDEAEATLNMQAIDRRIGSFQIGRFEIERELGRGGLGVVLLARDPVLRRQVALKVPRPEALLTPDLRKRFQREAQAAARLTHPHIVPVHEVGEAGAICFIAAELVAGPNLGEWLKAQTEPIVPRAAAALVADLAGAMDYAHRQGVLHRDLKPSNILLERRDVPEEVAGEANVLTSLVAKITDFGLARLSDNARDETRSGVIIGTPAYMSPEQAAGASSKLGPASDVYSLGAILYELLSGKPPFRGESDAMTLVQVMSDEPATLRHVQPRLPRDLEAICLRALAKEPQLRYASAGELAADLARFLAGEPTFARPLSARQRLTRWAWRHPAHSALGVVSLAALLTIAAGALFHTGQLNEALKSARDHANRAELNHRTAIEHEVRANEQLYVSQMRLADLAVHEGELLRAQSLLPPYGPGQKFGHLRGIEWHVLRSQVARMANDGNENSSAVYEHPDEVYAAQYTPDGRWLATGSQDGHLRVWDVAASRLLYDFKAHDACINWLRFSRDGTRLVTASCDSTARTWRVDSTNAPQQIHCMTHERPVRYVAFSPDGLQFASLRDCTQVSTNTFVGAAHIWNAETGEQICVREWPSPNNADGLAWSPDGRYLVTCGGGLVSAFSTADWQPHFSKTFQPCRIAFHPQSGLLTILEGTTVRQIDLDSKVEGCLLDTLHTGEFTWSPDGRFLAISGDGMAHMFDTRDANRPYSFNQHHNRRVAELTFSPDVTQLVTAGFDHKVCVTSLSTRLGLLPSVRRSSPILDGANTACDDTCQQLTYLDDGVFRRLALDSQASNPPNSNANSMSSDEPQPNPTRVLSIPKVDEGSWTRISPGGKRAVWVHAHKKVTIADLDRESISDLPFDLAKGVLRAYVFDERPVVFLIYDWTVSAVDLETNREIYLERIDADPTPDMFVSLSPDGRYLLILNSPVSIRLADLKAGTSRLVSNSRQNTNLPIFSPDGRSFCVVIEHRAVGVWDTETLKLRHLLQPRQRTIATAFSADSRTLAIAGQRELTLWHSARGHEMVSLMMPSEPAFIRFARDGSKFAWVSDKSGTLDIFEWALLEN